MAQFTIKINGFAYTLGCEDGQEAHLQAMSEQVEQRIENIKSLGSQTGEARLLVLASLLMADELHDLKAEMAALQSSRTPRPAKPDREMARSLAKMAARAEEIATNLELP